MKSKGVERLLRFLLLLTGVGVGLAVTQIGLQLYRTANPDSVIPAHYPVLGYTIMGIAGGLILLALSNRIILRFTRFSTDVQKQFDKMPVNQLMHESQHQAHEATNHHQSLQFQDLRYPQIILVV